MSEGTSDPKVARVIEAGRTLGIPVVPTRFPEGTRTAAEAADAIGVSVAEIANSLVFLVDGDPMLVLSSGAERVDLDALLAFDRVWAAAGTADTCFPVTPAELVRATKAQVVTVRVRG